MKFYEDELYIKMCSKAEEIQNIWKSMNRQNPENRYAWNYHYEEGYKGSFYYDKEGEIDIVDYEYNSSSLDGNTDVWLPRQDQLQEMIWEDYERRPNMKNIENWIEDFYLNYHNNWKKCFDDDVSMERLWLIYVMDKKFHKVWNGENWVKKEQ